MINFVLKIQENKTLFRAYHTVSSLVQVIPYYIMKKFYIDQDELNIIPGIRGFRNHYADTRRHGISWEPCREVPQQPNNIIGWWITDAYV